MQAQKLDHIGIKVGSIDAALPGYAELGFRIAERLRFQEVGIEIAFLELGGQQFELLESINDNSPIFTDPHGLHHVAFRCTDILGAFSEMQVDQRYCVLGPLTTNAHGAAVFFVRVRDSNALLELVGPSNCQDDEPVAWRW